MKILVLNVGSSTCKCWYRDSPDGKVQTARTEWKSSESGEEEIRALLEALPFLGAVEIVGHRIVHGGARYRESVFITPEVRAAIAEQAEFAPAHNRLELFAIEDMQRLLGDKIPQVAVFDTAFHRTLEPKVYVYPGPYAWLEQGIRRYGFHGISVQYATRRAAELLRKPREALRLIVCHLGNGASVTAVAQGKSVDTSMGFTPLEGIMMGTRSGSIDPAIPAYLLRHGTSVDDLDKILNRQSGLLGVSGFSGDMREILEAIAKGNDRARLAYDIYAHRLTREIGAMLAVLGGVDAIVFTGGIGENAAPLREDVCAHFGFLGLRLDAAKNAQKPVDQNIAAQGSAVQALVIRANEDWEIARECQRLAQSERAPSQESISPASTSST
jgi:acetate kinase